MFYSDQLLQVTIAKDLWRRSSELDTVFWDHLNRIIFFWGSLYVCVCVFKNYWNRLLKTLPMMFTTFQLINWNSFFYAIYYYIAIINSVCVLWSLCCCSYIYKINSFIVIYVIKFLHKPVNRDISCLLFSMFFFF